MALITSAGKIKLCSVFFLQRIIATQEHDTARNGKKQTKKINIYGCETLRKGYEHKCKWIVSVVLCPRHICSDALERILASVCRVALKPRVEFKPVNLKLGRLSSRYYTCDRFTDSSYFINSSVPNSSALYIYRQQMWTSKWLIWSDCLTISSHYHGL